MSHKQWFLSLHPGFQFLIPLILISIIDCYFHENNLRVNISFAAICIKILKEELEQQLLLSPVEDGQLLLEVNYGSSNFLAEYIFFTTYSDT